MSDNEEPFDGFHETEVEDTEADHDGPVEYGEWFCLQEEL